jgi:phage tail protein X
VRPAGSTLGVNVTAHQGDSVDSLCYRHLGSSDAVETVLDQNPGLAALGPILPMGTVVVLPDARDAVAKKKNLIQLWD